MSENNLFQFARVIADLPIQNTASHERQGHHLSRENHHHLHNYNSRYLNIRKVKKNCFMYISILNLSNLNALFVYTECLYCL